SRCMDKISLRGIQENFLATLGRASPFFQYSAQCTRKRWAIPSMASFRTGTFLSIVLLPMAFSRLRDTAVGFSRAAPHTAVQTALRTLTREAFGSEKRY